MRKTVLLLLSLVFVAGTQAITVAEAINIGKALENMATTPEAYTIEGYVTIIEDNSFSTSYKNMTFWIADTRGDAASTAEGAFCVYRGRPTQELQAGDKIRVTDKIKKWNDKIETSTTNVAVTFLESAPEEPVIEGLMRVCAQNLQNYYFNLNSGRGNYTQDEFVAKTNKIVDNMLAIDADIYAFCEVEAQPIVLQQLADSMNAHAGVAGRYTAVNDGISVTWSASADYNIKSGFIYRTDKVATVGNSLGGTNGNGYYAHTMRIQTFRQKSNNEQLVVSMNHFKAKDSSSDQGNATRETNATNLVKALKNVSTDPDILILGDLNCMVGETPLDIIANAGYEEQLLKYNPNAYSHCYNGGELIDHVYANESMAQQIIKASVKHVCTYKCTSYVTSSQAYSDHDPCVVDIKLGDYSADVDVTYSLPDTPKAQKTIENGTLFITLPDGSKYNVIGIRVR